MGEMWERKHHNCTCSLHGHMPSSDPNNRRASTSAGSNWSHQIPTPSCLHRIPSLRISRLTIEYTWGGPYRLATWTKLQFCNCTCAIELRHMSCLAASINPPTEGFHLIVPSCFWHHLLVDLQEKHYMTQYTLIFARYSSFYGHSSCMQYDHTTPLLHWLLVNAVTLLFCCFQNLLIVAASLLSRAPCVAVLYVIGSTYIPMYACGYL